MKDRYFLLHFVLSVQPGLKPGLIHPTNVTDGIEDYIDEIFSLEIFAGSSHVRQLGFHNLLEKSASVFSDSLPEGKEYPGPSCRGTCPYNDGRQ